jgi:hypothetical protein
MTSADFVRDRLEITNLIHSYGHHADTGDRDAFVNLFDDTATVDLGMPGVRDKASLAKMMGARPQDENAPRTRHVMTNLMFREQSAAAASGSISLVFMSTTAGKLTPVATGVYAFEVACGANGWRITDWRIALDGAVG